MLFSRHVFAVPVICSILIEARPLDASKSRHLVARVKSYAVVNVDGGPTHAPLPPVPAIIVVQKTTTLNIINPGPTMTLTVTSVVVQTPVAQTLSSPSKPGLPAALPNVLISPTHNVAASSPATKSIQPSMSTTAAAPRNTPTTLKTCAPTSVTVTVPSIRAAADYYDDGYWHTSYLIKTTEVTVAVPTP